MPPHKATVATPAGPVTVFSDATHVTGIRFGSVRGADRPDAICREARRQLDEYFAGRRERFDLPLRIQEPPFRQQVLKRLAQVPHGKSLTYGELAEAVHNPHAARAVGQAVGHNPFSIVIPCHRVLAANGRLGGFSGGLAWKRYLLHHEGIEYRSECGTTPPTGIRTRRSRRG